MHLRGVALPDGPAAVGGRYRAVSVRAVDLEQAAATRSAIGPATRVVTVQNGVDCWSGSGVLPRVSRSQTDPVATVTPLQHHQAYSRSRSCAQTATTAATHTDALAPQSVPTSTLRLDNILRDVWDSPFRDCRHHVGNAPGRSGCCSPTPTPVRYSQHHRRSLPAGAGQGVTTAGRLAA